MKKLYFSLLLTLTTVSVLNGADVSVIADSAPCIEEQIISFTGDSVSAAETVMEQAAEPVKSAFAGSWWALLPPLLAIILALITKEVYFSLFAGIVLGGCFAADFSPLKSMDYIIRDGLISSVESTSGIFIFLVLLGMIVALINKSGAAEIFGEWAKKRVKTRTGSQLATFFLGILIFIDDYFNCLTVGNIMIPLTDKHRVSRAKLAFIIDATAAPVCMIAPISSWAAAV